MTTLRTIALATLIALLDSGAGAAPTVLGNLGRTVAEARLAGLSKTPPFYPAPAVCRLTAERVWKKRHGWVYDPVIVCR